MAEFDVKKLRQIAEPRSEAAIAKANDRAMVRRAKAYLSDKDGFLGTCQVIIGGILFGCSARSPICDKDIAHIVMDMIMPQIEKELDKHLTR